MAVLVAGAAQQQGAQGAQHSAGLASVGADHAPATILPAETNSGNGSASHIALGAPLGLHGLPAHPPFAAAAKARLGSDPGAEGSTTHW